MKTVYESDVTMTGHICPACGREREHIKPVTEYPTISICMTQYGRARAAWGLTYEECDSYARAVYEGEI